MDNSYEISLIDKEWKNLLEQTVECDDTKFKAFKNQMTKLYNY